MKCFLYPQLSFSRHRDQLTPSCKTDIIVICSLDQKHTSVIYIHKAESQGVLMEEELCNLICYMLVRQKHICDKHQFKAERPEIDQLEVYGQSQK